MNGLVNASHHLLGVEFDDLGESPSFCFFLWRFDSDDEKKMRQKGSETALVSVSQTQCFATLHFFMCSKPKLVGVQTTVYLMAQVAYSLSLSIYYGIMALRAICYHVTK